MFSHGSNEELWVLLLEKAYAKAYGCYEHIIGGVSYEAIKDLSGAPGQSFAHKKNDKDVIWDKLLYADKNQFIMSCGTEDNQNGAEKLDGHSENITK
jgi:calpain-15